VLSHYSELLPDAMHGLKEVFAILLTLGMVHVDHTARAYNTTSTGFVLLIEEKVAASYELMLI
jgi:hypothetical protein